MDTDQEAPTLPEGFKPWPPPNCQAFLRELEEAWASQPHGQGKHWILQVVGTNPLSGYMVVVKPVGP